MVRKGVGVQCVRAEKRVTLLSIVMVTSFLIAWSPYAIVCMLRVAGAGKGAFSPLVVLMPALFAKSSFVWNPIIYVALNHQVDTIFSVAIS